MKLVLNNHKPLIGQLQHSVYTVNEKEYKRLLKIYGPTSWIQRDYSNVQPNPFSISGYGWIVTGNGYEKETVYIRELTYNKKFL